MSAWAVACDDAAAPWPHVTTGGTLTPYAMLCQLSQGLLLCVGTSSGWQSSEKLYPAGAAQGQADCEAAHAGQGKVHDSGFTTACSHTRLAHIGRLRAHHAIALADCSCKAVA